MLYPKNTSPHLDPELFRNPTSEYRAAPFWAWNCDLNDDLLLHEIECMKQMGMGGFHMHVRVGMSSTYLSDEFMGHIRTCLEKARREHMLAWLYDEDKWPSGYAGGYVTKKKENRQKYLLFTPNIPVNLEEGEKLLGIYDVSLSPEGTLSGYHTCPENVSSPDGSIWYAVLRYSRPTPWFHMTGYADTMSPEAIRDFISITHERYRETIGDSFGTLCPAIFTDEPQMTRKTELIHADEKQDIILSFTPDFEESYQSTYGESFLEHLPEVIWDLDSGISLTRYHYHDHATERFASAYSDQIGNWCKKNNLLMTGHMMEEGSLRAQTRAVGECMRSYRSFTLPGIDMLCDGREFNTAKQCASSVHQQNCPGMLSELYGVTNWDFDFRGHKLQGDWQAALGVSVRVPHLYWASMHGESKRDYPASIGHQSSWWKEYSYIEDHFARINTLMTRGKPLIRIGIIHPIESYWIHYGPADRTGGKRADMDHRFEELTDWMLRNTIDFDFICESTLPSLFKPTVSGFSVGSMSYDAVIVPACETLRSTTLDFLESFRKQNGKVIFMGSLPAYENAVPSERVHSFASSCDQIPWSRNALITVLNPYRDILITDENGLPSKALIYGMRLDRDNRNVFICHADNISREKCEEEEHYRITLNGIWKPIKYDTMTGNICEFPFFHHSGNTILEWNCYAEDSLLLQLVPACEAEASNKKSISSASGTYGIRMSEEYCPEKSTVKDHILPDPVPFILHEPNVLVMDMAEWKIDDREWNETEEMLRIGVLAKEQCGMSTAAISGAQPWFLKSGKSEHTVTIRTLILSDIQLEDVLLALEDAKDCSILFNDVPVSAAPSGTFVDDAISTLHIGPILKGKNTLEITKPFTVTSSVENMFLLGHFGVQVKGRKILLTELPSSLSFGDWSTQGLPFYGGPLTYRFTLLGGKHTRIRLGLFSAPCVTLDLDGKKISNLSLAPHEADLGLLPPGPHTLDITVYASRVNTFGTFHLNDGTVIWYGPQAWRSTGMKWTYEYRLKPSGLLSEPHIITE